MKYFASVVTNQVEIYYLVGHCGFEPQTPVLSGLCSNQLS